MRRAMASPSAATSWRSWTVNATTSPRRTEQRRPGVDGEGRQEVVVRAWQGGRPRTVVSEGEDSKTDGRGLPEHFNLFSPPRRKGFVRTSATVNVAPLRHHGARPRGALFSNENAMNAK